MRIPVAFITDTNFIMQTGVAIWSLFNNRNPETEYTVYVIMAECSQEDKKKLSLLTDRGIDIRLIEVSLDKYKDIKQLAHIPIACLLKFNLCDLIANEEKIIYIDGDVYIRGDLTDLYLIELGDNYCGAVSSIEMTRCDDRIINAGVMLFNAKLVRKDNLATKLEKKRFELGDKGSMDQQTFNLMIPDRIKELPLEYNCIVNKILGYESKNYRINDLNALYKTQYKNKKQIIKSAVIVHYATTGKPWKYSWVVCGDEWYECYKDSPYGTIELKRENILQSHFKGFVRNYKNGGIKKVVKRGIWYMKAAVGKNDYTNWG